MILSRTDRQKLGVKRWIKSGGRASLVYATGVGKTNTALILIEQLIIKKPDILVKIIVPTNFLKDQWEQQLFNKGFSDNCNVQVVNSAIKLFQKCNLLIIDEIHMVATNVFSKIFEAISYDMILGLTATMERLDGKELLIKQYAPVCDTITMEEAKSNNWVSQIKEYAVLLDVDLSEYNSANREFSNYFSIFNWDFNLAMKCCTDYKTRNNYAKQIGISPRELMGISMKWMKALHTRKSFIQSHPKKLEVCKKILSKRKDKKCLTFSPTIKDAEKIKIGYVLHSKQSSKLNKEIIDKFNAASSGVLNSSKALDEGVDLKGLSVGIIMNIDSSKIRKTQKCGRICRFEQGKVAELFTLIIKNTQEWKWFMNSCTTNVNIINEEQLDKVLNGESIEVRDKELYTDYDYRY